MCNGIWHTSGSQLKEHQIKWRMPNVLRLWSEVRQITSLMLGRDCLRALFGKQFPPPLNWVKGRFSAISRSGFKVGNKWVLMPFDPLFAPKNPLFTHFWTHSRILTKTHLKPILSGNKLFSKKASRQPWPSITQVANCYWFEFTEPKSHKFPPNRLFFEVQIADQNHAICDLNLCSNHCWIRR